MLRVLQIINNMDIGGMETILMNYYRNINRKRIQFDFLIFNENKCFYEKEINMLGSKIYRVVPRNKNVLKNREELAAFFKTHHYEIVEIHQGVTYLLPLKLASKNKVKNIIIHNHGVDNKYKKGLYNLFRKYYVIPFISKYATNYVACSNIVLSDLFSADIINNKKYLIVNNAIDVDPFSYNEGIRNRIRKELGIGEERVVGHIGRFHIQKNQEFIIKLAKIMPEYKFLLVGDGESLAALKKEASDNVIFYGQSQKPYEIIQAFDVFILPSRWEGLALVAIEAQANGLPTILSDNVSREAKVSDNVRFLPLEVDLWERTIRSMSSCPRTRNEKMVIKNGYNVKKEVCKLEKFYTRINEIEYNKERKNK